MSRNLSNKTKKQSLGSMLYRTACVLLALVMLTAWAVFGVYAKYATEGGSNDSAGVAKVGVEVFNLVQYGQTVAGIDYSKVVPGADIPGPHIQLKINSEVSYTLYLEITSSNCPIYLNVDGNEVKVVYFDLTDKWELVKTVNEDNYTTCTYKYVVNVINGEKDYVFKAGVEHLYTDTNEITILQDDVIYVSERYAELNASNGESSFSLKFVTYVQQVM